MPDSKSDLHDVLKREKQAKALEKERSDQAKKWTETHPNSLNPSSDSSNASDSSKSKEKSAYEKAVTICLGDIRFYFLKENEFAEKIKALYFELESELTKYSIPPNQFLEYCKDSFDRYKTINGKLPLEPMRQKSFEHVSSSIRELVRMLRAKINK